MTFFQFLKSLDDLLYEVVSWLIFFPITLWRAFRHPLRQMRYAASELKEKGDARRFDDAVSPPILLLLTILFAHGIELVLIGDSSLIKRSDGLAGLISDDTSLIVLRILAFATFPLIFAVRTVQLQRLPLTRTALEPAFFAQCYTNAPYALLISLAATLSQTAQYYLHVAAAIAFTFGVIAFLAVEARFFITLPNVGKMRALLSALAGYVAAFAFMVLLALLVGGSW